ncbi:MAG: TonB-dependent receptor [Phenylobacterium sp.]|uniref:TonB-dependent receptor plug domain-containing protein n=1 Tax=Phenylobacterium sp. TaxID=1871053 RepID=UPI002732D1C3|nr:TonB-dependent receptor [Phenylobacterium sp.]MDP3174891.1 TonB-dependent receptor [Phenylobacterium sp.]
MKTLLFLSTAYVAMTLVANPAQAADATAPTPDVAGREGSAGLTEVVVTATRSPQPETRIGQSVTVLDEKTIVASQGVTLTDILEEAPSVAYSRNGGPGTAATVNIRGAEGQHTVVVVDGVKLNDPSSTQGGFNFGNLLIGDIGRIEILRGAQSTLWGSQAIGGVVNVVTREPQAPFEATADAEVGARDTAYLRAGVGGLGERLSWRLAGAYYSTDGFSAYKLGKEDDGYHNGGVSGRVRLAITDNVSAEARSVWSKGRTDIDGFNVDSAEVGRTEELVAYLGLNAALLDGRFKNRLAYAYTDTDRENVDPVRTAAPVTFDAAGQNRRWEYQGSFALSDTWNATFGVESERARMRTRSPSVAQPNPAFIRGRVGLDSAYLQVQGVIADGLTITGGVRHDDHDTYGGKSLGQAAVAWSLNDGATVLRASFGQGFRAPGLYELFSEFGNTTLAPESFDAWDAGIRHRFAEGVSVSATYFHRDADNEIRFNSCNIGTTDPLCAPRGVSRFGYYLNVQKTQAQGVELEGSAKIGERLSLKANYTWTEALNDSGANRGKQLTRRPEHMGFAQATYDWPIGLSTAIAARYAGRTFNNDANTIAVSDYVVVDLRATYPIREGLEVYGRVENLFDEDYQTILNFGTPDRGAFVGLRARF